MTYREIQKLNVGWIWGILTLSLFITFGGIFTSLLLSNQPGPGEWIGGVVGMVMLLTILIFMATMTLKTRIDEYGIEAGIAPFVNKKFFWREVESVTIEDHDNLQFGYKINPFTKTEYLALNRGQVIVLHLRNGGTFRIGTQQPEEAEAFLQELFDTDTAYAEPIQNDLLEELQRVRMARSR